MKIFMALIRIHVYLTHAMAIVCHAHQLLAIVFQLKDQAINSVPMRSPASINSDSPQQSTSRLSRNMERSNELPASSSSNDFGLPVRDNEPSISSNQRLRRKRNQDTAIGNQSELNLRRSLRSKRKKNDNEYLYY